MKRKFVLILILSFIVLISYTCKTHCNNEEYNEIDAISINLEETIDEIKTSQIFSGIRIVQLETTPESLIGDFNKIIYSNDLLYVSTGSSIVVFTSSGSFIKRFEARGKGPGEYISIYDILIDEYLEKIEILDANTQKVIVYDMFFNFLYEYSIGRYAMNFAQCNDGSRIFHCGNDISGSKDSKILLFKDKRLEKKFLTIDRIRSKYLHMRLFDLFSYYNDMIIITDPHNDTIYSYDGINILPRYVFDIGKKKVPEELYRRTYQNIADFGINVLLGSGFAYGVFNFLESENTLFFRFDERISSSDNVYGELDKNFVLYDKNKQNYSISQSLIDDLSFSIDLQLDKFIYFYSQRNGTVIYAIPAHEFSRNEFNQRQTQQSTSDGDDGHLSNVEYTDIIEMKELDNPVIFIGKLR